MKVMITYIFEKKMEVIKIVIQIFQMERIFVIEYLMKIIYAHIEVN